MGESPMNGNAFTYVLILDPIRKTDPVQKTGIEVIQLVQVKKRLLRTYPKIRERRI